MWMLFMYLTHLTDVTHTLQEPEELAGRGVVVGCYDTGKGEYELTERAREVDQEAQGKLSHMINV